MIKIKTDFASLLFALSAQWFVELQVMCIHNQVPLIISFHLCVGPKKSIRGISY